jgi:hypothetical protein
MNGGIASDRDEWTSGKAEPFRTSGGIAATQEAGAPLQSDL